MRKLEEGGRIGHITLSDLVSFLFFLKHRRNDDNAKAETFLRYQQTDNFVAAVAPFGRRRCVRFT